MSSLSRSTKIIFIFDLLTLAGMTGTTLNYLLNDNLNIIPELITVSLVTLTGLFSLFLKGNYKIREFNITFWNIYRLLEGCIFAHIPAFLLLLFFTDIITNFKFLIINIPLVFVLLLIYRVLFHTYLFYFKQTKNILIIGTDQNAKIMSDEIINKKALKMHIVGFIEDTKSLDKMIETNDIKIYKQTSDIKEIIEKNKVDIVIVAIHRRMEELFLTKLIHSIPKNVKLYTMPEFYEMVTGKLFIDKMSINGLFFNFMKQRSVTYNFLKRAFDIIAATIILTVTLPITLTTALRVWMTDGGNPVYTQKRVGKGGSIFNCYKLRTMYKNDFHPKKNNIENRETQDNDERVIPFCKLVRKARFDEIPQMINILKGEMSIVGPRAEWEDLVNIYNNEVKGYACRMWTKTGWTGWAQINQGHCISTDDITEKLQYDLYYLKHRNIFWEISILVKAVFLALGGRHD